MYNNNNHDVRRHSAYLGQHPSHFLNENRQVSPENYGAIGALNAPSLTLADMLIFALQDEYLARSRYDAILNTFGYVRTFAQIREAEIRHINALLPLFERYSVPIPEDVSDTLLVVPETLKDAFALGVQGEIENIAMYERFLSFDIPPDMRTVFTQLRHASINHLAAFEQGLVRTP